MLDRSWSRTNPRLQPVNVGEPMKCWFLVFFFSFFFFNFSFCLEKLREWFLKEMRTSSSVLSPGFSDDMLTKNKTLLKIICHLHRVTCLLQQVISRDGNGEVGHDFLFWQTKSGSFYFSWASAAFHYVLDQKQRGDKDKEVEGMGRTVSNSVFLNHHLVSCCSPDIIIIIISCSRHRPALFFSF